MGAQHDHHLDGWENYVTTTVHPLADSTAATPIPLQTKVGQLQLRPYHFAIEWIVPEADNVAGRAIKTASPPFQVHKGCFMSMQMTKDDDAGLVLLSVVLRPTPSGKVGLYLQAKELNMDLVFLSKDYDKGGSKHSKFEYRIYSSSSRIKQKITFEVGILFDRDYFEANFADQKWVFSDLAKKVVVPEKLSDFTIICKGRRFCTYKYLLAANSDVFFNMFDQLEGGSSELTIEDMTPETMKLLLGFLQDPDVDKEESFKTNIKELYKAADKFNIPSLRQKCSVQIAAESSIENCIENLIFAHEQNDNWIRLVYSDYFWTNKEAILETEEWKKLGVDHPEVVKHLMLMVPAFTVA